MIATRLPQAAGCVAENATCRLPLVPRPTWQRAPPTPEEIAEKIAEGAAEATAEATAEKVAARPPSAAPRLAAPTTAPPRTATGRDDGQAADLGEFLGDPRPEDPSRYALRTRGMLPPARGSDSVHLDLISDNHGAGVGRRSMRYNHPLTAQYASIGFGLGLCGLLVLAAQFGTLRRGGSGSARSRGRARRVRVSGGGASPAATSSSSV